MLPIIISELETRNNNTNSAQATNSLPSFLETFLPEAWFVSMDKTSKDFATKKVDFMLPEEAIAHIFTCFTDPSSFANFAATSRQQFRISQNPGPVGIISSYPVRKFVFIRDIAFSSLAKTIPFIIPIEAAETSFYNAFNQRCFQLSINIGSEDFNFYMRAAVNHLAKISGREFRNKIAKVAINFGNNIYTDMVLSYASRSANEITLESFNSKVAQIKNLFPKRRTVDIEASLREAFGENHRLTFLKQSQDYRFFRISGPYFTYMKEQYKQELQSVAAALCGEADKIKAREDAHAKMIAINFKLNEAKESYLDRMSLIFSFNRRHEFSTLETLLRHFNEAPSIEDPDLELLHIEKRFQLLYQQYLAAKNKFESLALICDKLDHFDEDFMASFRRIREFYGELAQVVNAGNKEERQETLHAILNG